MSPEEQLAKLLSPPHPVDIVSKEELLAKLKQGRPLRIKVTVGETGPLAETAAPAPRQKPNDVAERALANPEVQRFRELFGGEARDFRNLKE